MLVIVEKECKFEEEIDEIKGMGEVGFRDWRRGFLILKNTFNTLKDERSRETMEERDREKEWKGGREKIKGVSHVITVSDTSTDLMPLAMKVMERTNCV